MPAGSALRYVCVIAHVDAAGTETTFEGTCTGTMAAARAGERGFGYDPVFVPDGDTRTMAELDRRREGRDLAPRPRRARAGGMAAHVNPQPGALARAPWSRSSPTAR